MTRPRTDEEWAEELGPLPTDVGTPYVERLRKDIEQLEAELASLREESQQSFDEWQAEWKANQLPGVPSSVEAACRSAFNAGAAYVRAETAERIVREFFGGEPNDGTMRAEFDFGLGRRTCKPSELVALIKSVLEHERSPSDADGTHQEDL